MSVSTSVLETAPPGLAAASRPERFTLRSEWGILIPIAAVCAIFAALEAVTTVICQLDPLLTAAG